MTSKPMPNNNRSTALRWLIAAIVVAVTFWLTLKNTVSSEWDAVFLAVIGYYFKDRPSEDRYKLTRDPNDLQAVRVETVFQFGLAFALVVLTFIAFIAPYYKASISGVWIG